MSGSQTITEWPRRVLDCIDDAVTVTDPLGRIEWVNAAFTRITGHPVDQAIGSSLASPAPAGPEQAWSRQLLELIRKGRAWKGRIVFPAEDGTLSEREVDLKPIPGDEGRPTHVVTLIRSDRREAEPRLAQAQRVETVGVLAGNIAHDFNNLLTIIRGNVMALLDASAEPDPIRGPLLDVQKAAGQAAELSRDLLAFSRNTRPRSITCDLNQVADEALRLMRHVIPPDVELRTDFSSDPLWLTGDPTQLHQVIVNLCLNARDAMPQGGTLTLRTRPCSIAEPPADAVPGARTGPFAVLSFEDTGHGMDQAVLAQIFEPFFTTKGLGQGTGLGLPIVRDIVARHGGWTRIDSSPGRGTRVEAYFPSGSKPVDRPGSNIDPNALRGCGTVLVVDDEPMIVALLRTVLESRGYRVLTAQSAVEALATFNRHRGSVAAVVLDRSLPKVNGLPVFEKLRRLAADIPLVFMSGSLPAAEDDVIPADEHTRFLAKPFAPTEVLVALKALLSRPEKV